MGILDKLDKFIPGHKQRESDREYARERDDNQVEIDKWIAGFEKLPIYQDYMEDDIRHSVEFHDKNDLISSLLYSAISNKDVNATKYLSNLVGGDFDLKAAVEDVDDPEFYDMVVSMNKDEDFWKKNTNMKRKEEFPAESVDPLISGANYYL